MAPITVAHLVLPPIFAVLAVLAWAWLLRLLVPDHWLSTLGLMILCMLLLGEVHHAYGNLGFVRIFQGKGIELCWSVPAITGCAIVWMRKGRLGDWLLLVASQIAAIGITSTGLFVAPLAAAFALAGGWRPGIVSLRRLILGVCASWYVVVVGVLLALAKVAGHEWSPGSAAGMAPLGQIVVKNWGYWSTLPLLWALLVTWVVCDSRNTARMFAGMSLLFLIVCFNPYTYRLMAHHVMGESAFWRLSWAIPLPLMLAVVIRMSFSRALAAPIPWRGWKWVVVAAGCVLALWSAREVGTLRPANHVTLGLPGIKAPPEDYALAKKLVEEMPESETLLAPVSIASWCSTFVIHPQLLSVRPMYLTAVTRELGRTDVARRFALQLYVSGWRRAPDAIQLLKDGISRYHLQTVVVARVAPRTGEIGTTLSAEGFHASHDENYVVWRRTQQVSHRKHGEIQ